MIEARLEKLMMLRDLRERVRIAEVSRAKKHKVVCVKEHHEAQLRLEAALVAADENMKKALLASKSIQDSVAQFAGLAIMMRKNNVATSNAEETVEEGVERLQDADEMIQNAKANYQKSSHDKLRFEKLIERVRSEILKQRSAKEEDETSELFTSKRVSTYNA
ncbi:hypothetical protein F9L33_09500 [Amylibacter sp. SFDW26]|uniref:hypothetical protein n=1 Tax=Amylibacter sp. SFDW26 TaxID=2652722 RepID=UPI0012627301|nr:hypothetical protein [Amylibacter sp. SFDW26]KAB7613605.1 hypothetical protein F9L33_09500 [Amylibacter sp. SFDW26]